LDEPARAAVLEVLGEAQRLGFIGPGPMSEQFDHALAFAPLLPDEPGLDGLDLGSGGGLPALPLVIVRPDIRWTLVDAMIRRTDFLRGAVAALALDDRVTVVTSRAEELPAAWRGRFDLATARAFGRPAVVAECAAPWLRVGGALVVSEPPGGGRDRWPVAGLELLGLAVECSVEGPPALVRLRQRAACAATYPRRTGVPAKRPLW
jgi:16S rRNA (guanine527-N7)-methyltransferase